MILVGGSNKYKQLLAGSENVEIYPPQIIDIDSNIRSFSTYANHSVKIDEEGQAFVIGNDLKFRIGTPIRKIYTEFSKFVIDDLNEKFISAYCGHKFTLYITETHKLILCSELDVQRTPRIYELETTPSSLFGGSDLCAIIDERGSIYVINPTSIFSKITKKTPKTGIQRISPSINLPSQALMVACGNKMLITLTKKKELYSNQIDKTGKVLNYELLLFPTISKSSEITYISGTSDTFFALDSEGLTYVFTTNLKQNKLSLSSSFNNNDIKKHFVLVDSLSSYKIKSVYAGANHSLFITDKNEILSYGSNKSKQLLLKDFKKSFSQVPVKVELGDTSDGKTLTKSEKIDLAIAGSSLSVVFLNMKPKHSPNQQKCLEMRVHRKSIGHFKPKITPQEQPVRRASFNSPSPSSSPPVPSTLPPPPRLPSSPRQGIPSKQKIRGAIVLKPVEPETTNDHSDSSDRIVKRQKKPAKKFSSSDDDDDETPSLSDSDGKLSPSEDESAKSTDDAMSSDSEAKSTDDAMSSDSEAKSTDDAMSSDSEAKSTDDAKSADGTKDAESTGDAKDTKSADGTKDAKLTDDSKSADDAKDTKSADDTKDAKSTDDVKPTDDAKDTKSADDTKDAKSTDDVKSTDDAKDAKSSAEDKNSKSIDDDSKSTDEEDESAKGEDELNSPDDDHKDTEKVDKTKEELERIKKENEILKKILRSKNNKRDNQTFIDPKEFKDIEHVSYFSQNEMNDVSKVKKSTTKTDYYTMKSFKNENFKEFRKFYRHFNIQSNMHHPCIVKFYGFANTMDEITYPSLLVECLPYSLRELMTENQKERLLNSTQKVELIIDIAYGMRFLHEEQHIVHRNLKPENILITKKYHAKIGDLAWADEILDEANFALSKKLVGWNTYTAPEIIRGLDYHEKVDQFAFGKIVYYILNDGVDSPFSFAELEKGITFTKLPSLTELALDLIDRCCAYSPSGRPLFSEVIELIENGDFMLLPDVDVNKVKERALKLRLLEEIENCGGDGA